MNISKFKWIFSSIQAKSLLFWPFLFFFTIITFSSVSAQQKLLSIKKYDSNGLNASDGDSIVFIYGNNPGTLSSNEPVFDFDGTFINWVYREPLIKCDKEYRLSASNATPIDTINYQLTAGLVTMKEGTLVPPKRILYTYNPDNSIAGIEKKVLYSFSTVWQTESKEEYEYYSNGLKSVTRKYFSDQILLISVDSMFYNNNNKLIKSKSTEFNISTGQPSSIFESIISYNGNEVSNVKTFFGSDFSFFNLQLKWDLDYSYVAGKVDQITGTGIGGEMVLIDYTYDNLNQKIRSVIGYKNGALDRKEEYEYDNNGFITKEKLQTSSSPGVLYVTNENKFYYEQSTTSTGIYENSNSFFSVFPNPASDQITIETNEYLMGNEFAIYNSIGKSVRKGSITTKETIVNLNDLATGIYILNINNQGYKVIKQ
uniref:T9SS type A sorting domain-containing protein n=1 Tax=Fluviicola sp. TaxID=1917219 RepID=UPI00404B5A6B